jgi:hypothetical protein
MEGLGALRLRQSANMGDGQVKILIREALLYVTFSVGILVGYFLSVIEVFNYRRLESQPIEFASFAAVGFVGIPVNRVAMCFCVAYLGNHYLPL